MAKSNSHFPHGYEFLYLAKIWSDRYDRVFGKKRVEKISQLFFVFSFPLSVFRSYIIPPIPPAGIAGIAGTSAFFSAKTHSVVRNIEAIEAAFSKATRDTFVGSIIPASSISS